MSKNAQLCFDYVIVGAGTAGCLLANRLSANPNTRVLLIEAGGKDDYHWIHVPVGYLYCIGNPRTDWLYQTQAQPGLGGRSLRYPRGKVLGGCSSINGMIYMRGQSRDYDSWAHITQDPTWSWSSCLPYFKFTEDHHLGASAVHGAKSGVDYELLCESESSWRGDQADAFQNHLRHLKQQQAGGEWRVEPQRLRWGVLEDFSKACEQAGIAQTADFNTGNNLGVGYFEVNQSKGIRWNTAKAFLRPTCYGRANFEMWTHAQVTQLALTRNQHGLMECTGLEVLSSKGQLHVQAKHEVILCAGAIATPQLLQLSGIGDQNALSRLGIECKIHSPGVGANLQDHLQLRLIFKVQNTTTLNTLSRSWWGKAKMGLEYVFNRSGPLSMAPSQLGVFTKSYPQLEWPDLQYHVQPLSLSAFGEPLHEFDAMTASVCNLNPSSRGEVRLQSTDPKAPPLISPNYLSTDEDCEKAIRSIRLTRELMLQPAMSKYSPVEWMPGTQHQLDADLREQAGQIGTTIFHPVGTARMGALADPMAVLDSRFRVQDHQRGACVQGLRVVDASAMPTITSGNTNSPTLMMAEKAAHWIAADHAHNGGL